MQLRTENPDVKQQQHKTSLPVLTHGITYWCCLPQSSQWTLTKANGQKSWTLLEDQTLPNDLALQQWKRPSIKRTLKSIWRWWHMFRKIAGLNFTASGAHSRSWEKPWRSGFINVWIASASCPLHSNNSFCLFSFKIASIETPALSSIISFVLCFFWTCFPFERLIFKTSENLQTSNATWKTRHLEKWREKTFEFMSTWQWNKSHWILHQA